MGGRGEGVVKQKKKGGKKKKEVMKEGNGPSLDAAV